MSAERAKREKEIATFSAADEWGFAEVRDKKFSALLGFTAENAHRNYTRISQEDLNN